MKQKPIIRLPQLYDAGSDISKKWFVYYSVRNPKTGKMERFKEFSGLKLNLSASDRHIVADKLIRKLTEKLRAGWTPYNDPSVVYADNLQFQTAIKEYRKAVSLNGTFNYFASKLLDQLTLGHEDATISTYRSKLRCFNAWLEGLNMDMCDVSTFDNALLTKFFLFIIKERKLSKNSVQKYDQILYAAFKLVCKERKGFVNPVIEMPTTSLLNENPPFPIREDEISTITKVLETRDPQLLFASKFLFYCSIRPGNELRFLTIKDLDLYRGTINVTASRAKTRLSRKVTIPQQFLTELNGMNLSSMPTSHYLLSHDGKPGPKPLGKNAFRQRWAVIRTELNLPDYYKFYSWKHTGNVCAVDAGIPLRQIQLQNGHTSIRTTEVYIKNKAGSINPEVKNNWPTM